MRVAKSRVRILYTKTLPGRSGACLIRPGVVGEALGGDKVLAGGEPVAVHVAPAGPSAVHGETVALHHPGAVQEGEGGALAAQVDIRGGGLLHRQAAGGGAQGEEGEHGGEHRSDIRDLSCYLSRAFTTK